MFAIKITGLFTGAEFILDGTYATEDEATRVLNRMKDANKGSMWIERSIVKV